MLRPTRARRPLGNFPALRGNGSRARGVVATKGRSGWSLGYVSAVDSEGRTIWIADGHRGDGKRFVARSEEKLTAFLELESAIRAVSP